MELELGLYKAKYDPERTRVGETSAGVPFFAIGVLVTKTEDDTPINPPYEAEVVYFLKAGENRRISMESLSRKGFNGNFAAPQFSGLQGEFAVEHFVDNGYMKWKFPHTGGIAGRDMTDTDRKSLASELSADWKLYGTSHGTPKDQPVAAQAAAATDDDENDGDLPF